MWDWNVMFLVELGHLNTFSTSDIASTHREAPRGVEIYLGRCAVEQTCRQLEIVSTSLAGLTDLKRFHSLKLAAGLVRSHFGARSPIS